MFDKIKIQQFIFSFIFKVIKMIIFQPGISQAEILFTMISHKIDLKNIITDKLIIRKK